MSADQGPGGLHIDSDWKQEAAREKARLAEQERGAKGEAPPSVRFLDLINLIAMQALVGLGGLQGPDGEQIPANPALAQHHIDLLALLVDKTRGNLTPDEERTLETVLYELRMQYVELATPVPRTAPPDTEEQRS
jgi:hypothetical protein